MAVVSFLKYKIILRLQEWGGGKYIQDKCVAFSLYKVGCSEIESLLNGAWNGVEYCDLP